MQIDSSFSKCNSCASDNTLIWPSPGLSLCKNVVCSCALSLASRGQQAVDRRVSMPCRIPVVSPSQQFRASSGIKKVTQLLFCFTVELCKQGSSLYACSVQSWTSGTGNFLLTFHPRASAPCHYTQHVLFHLSPRTSKGRRLHFCNVKGEQFQFPCLFLLQKARCNFTGSKYFHGRMTVEMLLLKRELYTNQLTVLQCLRFNGIFPFTSLCKWTFLLSYSIPVKTSVPDVTFHICLCMCRGSRCPVPCAILLMVAAELQSRLSLQMTGRQLKIIFTLDPIIYGTVVSVTFPVCPSSL